MRKSLIYVFCVSLVAGIALSLGLISLAYAKKTPYLSSSVTHCTNAKTCDGRYAATTYDSTGKACAATLQVIAITPITDGNVFLYYSQGCKTNWAEVLTISTHVRKINANVTRQTDGAKYQSTMLATDVLSPMVYAPVAKAQACGSINNWKGGCTRYYSAVTHCTNAKTCDGRYAATTYDSTGKVCAATQQEIALAPITDGDVILYYSQGCKTNWAWVVDGNTYIMNVNLTRQTDGAKYQTTMRGVTNLLSPMVYAPVAKAQACGSINNWTGGCTGYY